MPTYLDFGDNESGLENSSLLMTDSPKICFTYDPEDISDDAAVKAGKIINKNRCISLLFLLLPNPEMACKFCNQVRLNLVIRYRNRANRGRRHYSKIKF